MTTPLARWTSALAQSPALTIRQPWAWLIVNGCKDIENRSRPTKHRGPLLIHAGQNTRELDALRASVARTHKITVPEEVETGGIIGIVDVIGCAQRPLSPWHEAGHFGWVLANPRRLKFRACRGALGFFRPVFDAVDRP